MVLWDRAVLPYPFDFDTCIKVKLDSSCRIHTNFPTLSLSFQWGSLGPLIQDWCCFYACFNFPDWIRVFSEFSNLERARLWLSKINSSTIGTMRRTAITVNYLQNAVSSSGAFFFLQRVALVIGVLLSLKSLLCLVGCLLACFLRRVALRAVLSAFWLLQRFTLLVGLLGLWGLLGLLRGGLCLLLFQLL